MLRQCLDDPEATLGIDVLEQFQERLVGGRVPRGGQAGDRGGGQRRLVSIGQLGQACHGGRFAEVP